LASPAILKLIVLADTSKAQKALGDTSDAAGKTGGGFGKMAKGIAGAVGTAAIVSFGKASVGAALESQKANANLEQGFKSMGETSGKAADEATKFASALSKKIGVDDDAIIASQALLVTFGNVSSEAARSAGIFDDTTTAAADLAAKGFGTLDSNAVLLGKALNDPTAGIGKLAKAGVQFTDQQKEQIKAMQASGDTVGAQKVMLGELEKQVGGTAAATATSQEKMTVAFGETQEAVGNALLPVLEKLAPILETVAGFVEDNAGWLVPMAAAIGAVVLAIKAWNIVQAILNVLMTANPIGLVVLGIVALIAVIVLMVKHWDKVKAAMAVVFDFIKGAATAVWRWVTDKFQAIADAVSRIWGSIKSTISGVFSSIKDGATAAWKWVTDKFTAIRDGIVGAFTGLGDIVKAPINAVIRMLNGFRIPKVTIGGQDPLGAFGPSIPTVTIGGWGFPHIPSLDVGGSVQRTGLALVHRGEQFSGVGNKFGGTTVINLNVTAKGLGADAPEIQRAVVRALRGWSSRNGPLDVKVRSA
jgi:phage-related protein